MIPRGPEPGGTPGGNGVARCTIVVFGAAGDLFKRLLVPAPYNLARAGRVPDDLSVLGIDIVPAGTEVWRADLGDTIRAFADDPDAEVHPDRIEGEAWRWLVDRMTYLRGDFTDGATIDGLAGELEGRAAIFYLAVAARFFEPIVARVGAAGLLQDQGGADRRIVIDKPFGRALASARDLNARILAQARVMQIDRIDHLRGKEPVQGLRAMRFANRMFEPFWRAEHVARGEITAAETIGIEDRGRFYDPTGALRDMVPSHLVQILSMVATDPSASLAPDAIRDEKTRLLAAIAPLGPDDVVLGEYGSGEIAGCPVPGYLDERDVAADSLTETYVAARLRVDNWRWAGTPFLVRTGKRMAARRTEIVLQLRAAPVALLPTAGRAEQESGRITLGIDPMHGIEIAFDVKLPVPDLTLGRAMTRFSFDEAFDHAPSVGNEALLLDCMQGDAGLFQRDDSIEAAWRIVDPVLGRDDLAPVIYPAGPDLGAARLAWPPRAAGAERGVAA